MIDASAIAKCEARIERIPFTSCWIWTGTDVRGYGRVYVGGKTKAAHRAMYEAYKGPIPEGLEVDHLCRVTLCVNPDHLEAVTPKVNKLRSDCISGINARRTHCPSGHEYTPDNTRIGKPPKLGRWCKACQREYNRTVGIARAIRRALRGRQPL